MTTAERSVRRSGQSVAARAGWFDVIEAAGAAAPDDGAWARRVVEAAKPVFAVRGFTGGLGFVAIRHFADCSSAETLFGEAENFTQAYSLDQYSAALSVFGVRLIRELWYPPTTFCVQSQLARSWAPDLRECMSGFRQRYFGRRDADVAAVIVHPTPGIAASLCAGYSTHPAFTRHHRRMLTQLGLHLDAGYRLRCRPEVVLAVVRPDGTLVHHEAGAPEPASLTASVRRIERSRTVRARQSLESLDLWEALLEGRASVVERIDGAQRFYFVLENSPATQPFRSLSQDELTAVSHAARGLPVKLIAYALGVPHTTVSTRLAAAAAKVGVATTIELVRLAAMLTRDPRARFEHIALTTAERDIMQLLAQGLSNAEIARIRNRSVRTIANQVAHLLRKTNSPSRRALAARS